MNPTLLVYTSERAGPYRENPLRSPETLRRPVSFVTWTHENLLAFVRPICGKWRRNAA